jgi:hypothetical protein
MSEYSVILVMVCCDLEHGKAKADIFEQASVSGLITGSHHIPAGTLFGTIALLSARACIEPKTYRAALCSAQVPEWQFDMHEEYSSLMANGTWELVDLLPDRVVVNKPKHKHKQVTNPNHY